MLTCENDVPVPGGGGSLTGRKPRVRWVRGTCRPFITEIRPAFVGSKSQKCFTKTTIAALCRVALHMGE